ncbi:nuclear transport factor 2 family protein [Sphingomonas crocodyli]|uniref:SnoaL-like domain-containing protein n=1 Tax=Sphingomonas crocodyli TaxID=1979270 RepID=A0A437M7H3_9SPHN|nr:nuclear transport factor 2 family protein [Sphingomonas crocodyli]RVT93670.1 hypothetical protein EOD43_07325 [Sphingomonas crocodyli]
MGVAENKDLAIRFINSISSGERDMSLLADDITWWVPGRGVLDRETFLQVANAFRAVRAGPFRMVIRNVTADEDRVAVETSGEGPLIDGSIYANDYHFLIRIEGGKIKEIREHNNSLIPYLQFGHKLPPMPKLPDPIP